MILLSKHSLHVTSRHAGVSAWFLIWDSNGPTHIYHTPVITVITILIWYLRCLELSHIFIGSNSLVDQNILHCIIGLRPLTVLPLDAEVLVWARIYQLPNATHQLALVAKVAAEVWGGGHLEQKGTNAALTINFSDHYSVVGCHFTFMQLNVLCQWRAH